MPLRADMTLPARLALAPLSTEPRRLENVLLDCWEEAMFSANEVVSWMGQPEFHYNQRPSALIHSVRQRIKTYVEIPIDNVLKRSTLRELLRVHKERRHKVHLPLNLSVGRELTLPALCGRARAECARLAGKGRDEGLVVQLELVGVGEVRGDEGAECGGVGWGGAWEGSMKEYN